MSNEPFRVNRSALPTADARQMFNTENCFAKGVLVPGERSKPRLAGNCQVVQFGKNSSGNDCMFACQADFSEVEQKERPVLASFVFDHLGRVIDLYYGNSEATPSWRTNVHNGTRASFGFLPQPSQTPKWGCTRVLKGPLDFIGCQRQYSAPLVEGVPFVSCVEVSADFDKKLFMSPQDERNVTPYFEHVPLAGTSKYGSSSREYYDTETFANTCGNLGHDSFVVLHPNGRTSTLETRQGSCPHPKPIPPRLSVSNPETRKQFEVELKNGHKSALLEIPALNWLETHPLVFPRGPIDETFADAAFGWVHDFSMRFKAPAVSLSSAALATMMESSLLRQSGLPNSAKASTLAMFAPAMRNDLFASLATTTRPAKPIATSCNCTPTKHEPMCKNRFCQFRYASVQRFSFEWPMRRIVSGPPELVILLADQIVESQDVERSKKLAAEVAEATRKADAAKKAADDAKKAADADAKRAEKNAAAREATVLRKEAAAAAKASGVATATPSLRGRRAMILVASSAAPVASSAAPVASSAAPVASSASAAPAAQKRKTSASASASAAPPSESRKKKKGGSKSKSKSKRRVRK
jgi:hypothetical protein